MVTESRAEPVIDTPVEAPSPHRFQALDSLRGICACLVALYHFRDAVSPIARTVFVEMSWQFVDLFFVISGFVIALNYRQRLATTMSIRRFMALRLGRIYPLHLVVLAVFLATEIAILAIHKAGIPFRPAFDVNHDIPELIEQLLFLDGIGNIQSGAWNYPTWSISTEFWAYLLFALCVVTSNRALVRIVAITLPVCALFLLIVSPLGIQTISDWGLIRCIYGFAAGVLTQVIWQRYSGRMFARDGGWTLAEVAVLALVALFVPILGPTKLNLLAPIVFAVTVLVFARQGGLVSRLLITPVPLFLGTISYSIYMVHVFVQQRIGNALVFLGQATHFPLTSVKYHAGEARRIYGTSDLQGTIMIFGMLALVIGIAALTYRFIEMPGQRWSRERIGRAD